MQQLQHSQHSATQVHQSLNATGQQLQHADRLITAVACVSGTVDHAADVAILSSRAARLPALVELAAPSADRATQQLRCAHHALERIVTLGANPREDPFRTFWAIDHGIIDSARTVGHARVDTREGAELTEHAIHCGTLTAAHARDMLRLHRPRSSPATGGPAGQPDNRQSQRHAHPLLTRMTRPAAVPLAPQTCQPRFCAEHALSVVPDPSLDTIAARVAGSMLGAGVAGIDDLWSSGQPFERPLATDSRLAHAGPPGHAAGLWSLITWVHWRRSDSQGRLVRIAPGPAGQPRPGPTALPGRLRGRPGPWPPPSHRRAPVTAGPPAAAPRQCHDDMRARRLPQVLIVSVAMLLIGACATPASPAQRPPPAPSTTTTSAPTESGYVTRIVDGDTIDVRTGSATWRARMLGIEASRDRARRHARAVLRRPSRRTHACPCAQQDRHPHQRPHPARYGPVPASPAIRQRGGRRRRPAARAGRVRPRVPPELSRAHPANRRLYVDPRRGAGPGIGPLDCMPIASNGSGCGGP